MDALSAAAAVITLAVTKLITLSRRTRIPSDIASASESVARFIAPATLMDVSHESPNTAAATVSVVLLMPSEMCPIR